jgi:hypothetical protein
MFADLPFSNGTKYRLLYDTNSPKHVQQQLISMEFLIFHQKRKFFYYHLLFLEWRRSKYVVKTRLNGMKLLCKTCL